jgi:hypothetical protein
MFLEKLSSEKQHKRSKYNLDAHQKDINLIISNGYSGRDVHQFLKLIYPTIHEQTVYNYLKKQKKQQNEKIKLSENNAAVSLKITASNQQASSDEKPFDFLANKKSSAEKKAERRSEIDKIFTEL